MFASDDEPAAPAPSKPAPKAAKADKKNKAKEQDQVPQKRVHQAFHLRILISLIKHTFFAFFSKPNDAIYLFQNVLETVFALKARQLMIFERDRVYKNLTIRLICILHT